MNRFLSAATWVVALFCLLATQVLAEDVYYYHTDTAGTPLAMSNATGQKVWEADYKPFGEEYSVSGTQESDRRFVGKEKDEETGLNYFGARYLAASTGRFLAPDPVRAVDGLTGKVNTSFLEKPQGVNLYTYSFNNPYRYSDPDGRIPLDTIWDLGNIIYDIATGDKIGLAADTAAFAIPYVPAGVSKLGKLGKLGKAAGEFASESKLVSHFEKHGTEFGVSTAEDYLEVGRDIMRDGQKVEYVYKGETRIGYVQYIGNRSGNGNAKFGFVGTNADGNITTIHVESGNSFWKLLNGSKSDKTIKVSQ